MGYEFVAIHTENLYGQRISIKNIASGATDVIEIQRKDIFRARGGAEGYGLRAVHHHKKLGAIHSFLKVFQKDIPERRPRSEFLVKLGLARHHEWVFQGVPYASFNKQKVNGVEIVGHLTKFIGLQYGKPGEEFTILRDDGLWDAISPDERRSLAAHLASTVCGLERLRLVHGDLSGGNIMVGPGPGGRRICCLCDFDGFYHPSQPLLPRQFENMPSRPLGTPGYQYPELMARIAADKSDSDNTIVVETDRFALGVLICEMMIWDTGLLARLGRPQLLDAATIQSRNLKSLPDEIRGRFPNGFTLLERALQAGSCADMPPPDDWLNCLGIHSVLPSPFKTPPKVLFFRRKGTLRRLHRHVVLNTKPNGNFGVIDSELSSINFTRDDKNNVMLSVTSQLPIALRRNGRQQILSADAKKAVAMYPGDELHMSDWEITFEESGTSP